MGIVKIDSDSESAIDSFNLYKIIDLCLRLYFCLKTIFPNVFFDEFSILVFFQQKKSFLFSNNAFKFRKKKLKLNIFKESLSEAIAE